jgi:hypothetical protein
MRLWEGTVSALAYQDFALRREARADNKFLIPFPKERATRDPVTLHRVYELQARPTGAVEISKLSGLRGLEILMQNVYRLTLAEYIGRKPAAFAVCAAAARQIPVFCFSRPIAFTAFEDGLDVLEKHIFNV